MKSAHTTPLFKSSHKYLVNGFTLIELIIAMAIIGVLAVVVLVAINPLERQARARDTGRIATVTQLGHAVEAFYAVAGNAAYPLEVSWAQDLIDSGELTAFPSGIEYNYNTIEPCESFVQPGTNPTFCYDLDTVGSNGALVFTTLESTSNLEKCTIGNPYFVYSTADGHGGTICSASDPTPWVSGSQTYVD